MISIYWPPFIRAVDSAGISCRSLWRAGFGSSWSKTMRRTRRRAGVFMSDPQSKLRIKIATTACLELTQFASVCNRAPIDKIGCLSYHTGHGHCGCVRVLGLVALGRLLAPTSRKGDSVIQTSSSRLFRDHGLLYRNTCSCLTSYILTRCLLAVYGHGYLRTHTVHILTLLSASLSSGSIVRMLELTSSIQ